VELSASVVISCLCNCVIMFQNVNEEFVGSWCSLARVGELSNLNLTPLHEFDMDDHSGHWCDGVASSSVDDVKPEVRLRHNSLCPFVSREISTTTAAVDRQMTNTRCDQMATDTRCTRMSAAPVSDVVRGTHTCDSSDHMTSKTYGCKKSKQVSEVERHLEMDAVYSHSMTVDQMKETSDETPGVQKPFDCFECGQKFSQSSSLARHILIHSGIRRYSCDLCGKTFTQPGHVDIHRRTHTGEKPYQCSECDKAFSDSAHLNRHRRIHANERRYVCGVCNKAFRQSGTLNTHIRTHAGLKPFTCDVCEKGFVDASHLTIHLRNHSGERPYKCPVCEKSFMNTSHLNRHRRIHDDTRTPICDLCGKTFTKRTSLVIHKRIHNKPTSTTTTTSHV